MTEIRLRILYATVSGTAREVAEAIGLAAFDLPSGAVRVEDMHDANPDIFNPAGPPLLLVVATTGSGDIPPDAVALYQSLQDQPRYLGGLRYGLVALGDSSYGSTFCGGGRAMDDLLIDMGAQRIADMLRLDAIEDDDPTGSAARWFDEWRMAADLPREQT